MGKRLILASEILDRISGIMDYEMLVSTSGIREADSNFMWATTFRAPVGINFIRGNVSINLFLPQGSENSKDVNLFFNRVGAKFQDGLWQVRRNLTELSDVYGSALQLAVSTFRSLMVDYSYIHKGRYHAHFTFNSRDLLDISSLIVTYSDLADGYRVEYMRRLKNHSQVYRWINAKDKVTNVTLQIAREGTIPDGNDPSRDVPFILANFLDDRGTKGIAISNGKSLPQLLKGHEESSFADHITSFWSTNEVLTYLVSGLASSNIVIYGLYGLADQDSIRLVIPVPVQQTTALLRLIKDAMTDFTKWDLKLLEITDYDMEYGQDE